MNILKIISSIFEPAAKVIDSVHTSEEEKIKAKTELTIVQNQIVSELVDLQTNLVEAKAKIITTEAKGESWLQRNWRPITMLTFVSLVVAHWLGFTAENLTQEEILSLMDLVKIGMGGYVVGRSAEKIMKEYKK